ncbi:Gfo/Idh/MocA family oxidoreductase, partial [Liquorilactobacillus nagelii]
MTKVITYGTFDLLHNGHLQLLKRAKKLGDFLIVGVTADSFDQARGKINVQQNLSERIANIKATGLADQIIVEEYEGQKIDDIRRFNIDIFAVGSDWNGKFDYLKDYCQVIYLDRTQGISSSQLRTNKNKLRIGIIGRSYHVYKFIRESRFINGVKIIGLCTDERRPFSVEIDSSIIVTNDFDELLKKVDALYITSKIDKHFSQIKQALKEKKHVLCEMPITLDAKEYDVLSNLAEEQNCILMPALKTAYATAYYRLLLLIKSGRIGDVVAVDSVCTSLASQNNLKNHKKLDVWGSMEAWGAIAILPIFQILGTNYQSKITISKKFDKSDSFDLFTKTDYVFNHATGSFMVGKGIKSEGQLIISGTMGYVIVPAPWWKTDYFEIRYENSQNNKRVFYQLEGEGIRYEILAFMKGIELGNSNQYISSSVTRKICNEFK